MISADARTPETCAWRLPRMEAKDGHVCGLALQACGSGDHSLCPVRPDECAACCRFSPPVPAHPNPLVASVLVKALMEIEKRGGVTGCTEKQAVNLKTKAMAHLLMIPADATGIVNRTPAYRGPCQHLGGLIAERLCRDCPGRVVQKVFACRHPLYDQTTIRQCQSCREYDPLLERGAVQTWAVGVTTAPRRAATLRRSLHSVRKAGWRQEIQVFAEAGSASRLQTAGCGPLKIMRRKRPPLGAWPNFLLSLTELYLRHPDADAFLLLQDDVILCRDLRPYLENQLWPGSRCGVVSLHTARHLAPRDGAGFFEVDLGWNVWGAQAFVFPNSAVRAILSDARVVGHRQRGIGDGLKNVDSVTGDWCRRTGMEFWLHAPSLAEHTGQTSTLWPRAGLGGRRSSCDFPGEDVSVSELMPRLLADRGGKAPPPVIMRPDGTLSTAALTPAGAAESRSPVNSWDHLHLDIVSVTVGRKWVWQAWCHWLLTAAIPPHSSLHLVDNLRAADAVGRTLLHAFQAGCLQSARFQTVSVTRGPGHLGERGSHGRDKSLATAFNQVFPTLTGDLVFILDDDVVPPATALPDLWKKFTSLRDAGDNPGLLSGCYESAALPGYLVAARNLHRWSDPPRVGELASDTVERVGWAGNGCLLADAAALRTALPVQTPDSGPTHGADWWICREVRAAGYSVWLHGGVVCRHLHTAPS